MWYVRVNHRTDHRHFVSKSLTIHSVLYMLIIRLIRELFWHRHGFLEDVTLINRFDVPCIALYLVDGYYQLLIQAIDNPFTALSTPNGLL